MYGSDLLHIAGLVGVSLVFISLIGRCNSVLCDSVYLLCDVVAVFKIFLLEGDQRNESSAGNQKKEH